ncbi:hypothetical protein PENTCL1PPCAC_10037, partial [Pristionchus entomophagus]
NVDSMPERNYRSRKSIDDLPQNNYRSSVVVNDLPEAQEEKQRDYYRALNAVSIKRYCILLITDTEIIDKLQYPPVERDTPVMAQSPSLQDEVFTNGSPVPLTKKKLVYRIPNDLITVSALPPNEYDYPPTERSGARIVDRSNLLRTVSTSSVSSLQDSPIRRLLSTHMEGDPKRVQRISTSGAGMPAPVVKTTILRCSNGRKAALIQVDEIARIIRWIDPSEENGQMDHNVDIKKTSASTALPRFDSMSIAPYELQLIDIVEEKIERRIPLDWPELFVLKNAHCRRVIPLEERLRTIVKLRTGETHSIDRLERQILDEYVRYETLIDRVVLCGSPYTRLAHSIMKADAFWFHARTIRDPSERSNMYRKAIDFYAELLERAETSMEADEVALLTLVQKLTRILAESANFDPQLVVKAALIVDRAEKRLEQKSDGEAARRIKTIRYNLDCVNEAARKHLV